MTEVQRKRLLGYGQSILLATIFSIPVTLWEPGRLWNHPLVALVVYGLIFGLIFRTCGELSSSIYRRSFVLTSLLRSLVWVLAIVISFSLAFVVLDSIRFGSLPWPNNPTYENLKVLFVQPTVWMAVPGAWLGVTIVGSVFEMSQKLGPGVLWNWVRGYYHVPREEERIFMFLDMRGSTSLAESLGDLKFSALIRDFFDDLTTPVIESKGEVSHYIGDEAVLTWKIRRGVPPAGFANCFAMFGNEIEARSLYYIKKYGVVPGFKAGVHCGRVVTTEVGRIKSEIVFHGDVLNTAARIQGMCSELGQDLLISADVADLIQSTPGLNLMPMGTHELKGKEQPVELFAVVSVPATVIPTEAKPSGGTW